MFKERLISGIIILLGILAIIYVGSVPLWISSLIVGCVGLLVIQGCGAG